jgi:hypothetical protein
MQASKFFDENQINLMNKTLILGSHNTLNFLLKTMIEEENTDTFEEKNKYKNIVFIVPVRNRDSQIRVFENHMCSFWNTYDSNETKLLIWFINQVNDWSFSRGWLFNVGLDLFWSRNMSSECITIHDVDLLPHGDIPYSDCLLPTHLYPRLNEETKEIIYPSYSGGVFVANALDWKKINGMSNEFRGWGGEDDEMFERWKKQKLTFDYKSPHRPKKLRGYFETNTIDHFRKEIISTEYEKNDAMVVGVRDGTRNYLLDGLQQVKYSIQNMTKKTLFPACNVEFIHVNVI